MAAKSPYSDEFRARVREMAATKSQGAVARELGISQSLVWKILKRGKSNVTASAAEVGALPGSCPDRA